MNKAPPFEKGWKHSDGVKAGMGRGDEKLGSEVPGCEVATTIYIMDSLKCIQNLGS